MLYIDQERILKLDGNSLKKQRVILLILSILLLFGGIFCLINPLSSDIFLTQVVSIFLVLSGIWMIVTVIVNRQHNLWPTVGGILLGIAYLILGYFYMAHPELGVFSITTLLAVLFALGGISRLIAGAKQQGGENRVWPQIIIGILDLVIAWMLTGNGMAISIMLISSIVGIEMLLSSYCLFLVVGQFKHDYTH